MSSAALFARSLAHLETVDVGFRSEGVVYGSFAIGGTPGSAYAWPGRRVAFYRGLVDRIDHIPGIEMSGLTTDLPFSFSPNSGFEEEGVPDDRAASLHFRLVGGRFFQTLGIPLREGRFFDTGDVAERPLVALINERAARTYWRDRSPIGQRIRMPGMDLNYSCTRSSVSSAISVIEG